MVNYNPSGFHDHEDTEPYIFRGNNLDLLGSRDVISHVTIGLGVSIFLLVVNDDHASMLHGYGDTPRRFWGHDLDFLGSRDVLGHLTIGLSVGTFLLVVHCNHASNLHRYGDMKPKRSSNRLVD